MMKAKDDMNAPQTMEDYGALLQERGVKPTAMRLLVYRELCKADRPLSLKDMEERMVTADRSTIFRALTLLLGHHLVHGLEDGSGALKYEVCHGRGKCTPEDRHPHFHCIACQRTFCLYGTAIPGVALPEGFTMVSANYVIKGVCPDCSAASCRTAGR